MSSFNSTIRSVLQEAAGLKPDEHGQDTPNRFVSMLNELTECKTCDGRCIKWKDFDSDSYDELITVEGIPFSSVCNHHVVPFVGKAYVAYVPKNRMAGLSKFARIVRHFSRRLQLQERLTAEVAQYINGALSPRGVGVVIRAEHLCMTIRGAQAPGTLTTTASMLGVFGDHTRTAKTEFLSYINGNGRH